MESFHKEFIRKIKRNIVNDPSIFTEKEEEPIEQERLADEESGEDRSIQSRIISFFRSNNQDGLFDSFLKQIDNTENRYLDQINELDNNTTQPQVTQSTTINQTPQPISASVVNLPTPQTSTLIPADQIGTTTQLDSNTVSSISSSTPTWIKNIYDKYQDKLLPITVPVNNIDRAGREMLFNEIMLWVIYALDEENIKFPHDFRELRDVIIPPSYN
ncbi:immunodominant virion protein [Cheloniid poxvirus 1]|nr:immunodominant virion protein [Cheloniid poxvirus 1]